MLDSENNQYPFEDMVGLLNCLIYNRPWIIGIPACNICPAKERVLDIENVIFI